MAAESMEGETTVVEGLYMAEEEEGDTTIIDLLNTNQRLHQNEGSGTESSSSNDQSSFSKDEPGPKTIEATQPEC